MRREGGEGGWYTQFVHGRSRMTIDPRIPIMPGRSTLGFHQPGRGGEGEYGRGEWEGGGRDGEWGEAGGGLNWGMGFGVGPWVLELMNGMGYMTTTGVVIHSLLCF